jgi:GNAT superfamily N-acetyltransferase
MADDRDLEDRRELEDLLVDPDAMRGGVGTRLVLGAVARAARDGVPAGSAAR